MKVIIFGAKGMLGEDLGKVFYDARPYLLDKNELDITDEDGVRKLILRLRPDVVINAAGYTDVDGCETNRELAMKVNGEAPCYLAAAAHEAGAIFAHYSTDYVFDGKKQDGYSEDDEPGNPLNFYGVSKLAGEKAVREAGGDYYLIRTSWLFGLHGKNFIETVLKLAQEQDELRVVNDQHGKPACALDVARQTRALIEEKKDFGIYHIVNEPATTWYDFAKEILGQSRRGRSASRGPDPARLMACASSEFPRPAKRPQYSILLNTKLPPLRSWQDALREYLRKRN